ncbi:MAG TPA: hypothetical protein PKH60_04185 [Candidatus Woesebacteria bacterium]|nr:hypothetical protein [Candidatus Woesebacteria bacterium]
MKLVKEKPPSLADRRSFLRFASRIFVGFVATSVVKSAVGEPQTLESQRELELQNLDWYSQWINEGRSVRLVDDQMALSELDKLELVDVDLTQGLAAVDHPLKYAQQIPQLIQNFQNDSLVEQAWVAPMRGGWTITVNRYANLTDLDSQYENLKQNAVKPLDYPDLLKDWSNKSVVTFSKTVGDYEIVWSISNTGGQSNPLLQGGRVERGDYTLSITSKMSGERIAAVGFVGRLIESGLDVQHAFKNVGLHSLKRYADPKTGSSMAYFNFGSLHPPGSFPLENTHHTMASLDEKQINVLVAAILAFVSTTVSPQIAVTTV